MQCGQLTTIFPYKIPTIINKISVTSYGSGDLRYGVVTAAAPGMAGGNTFEGHFTTFPRTIFADSFQSVSTTGRRIAAFGAKKRRDSTLVKADEANEQYGKKFTHRAGLRAFVPAWPQPY